MVNASGAKRHIPMFDLRSYILWRNRLSRTIRKRFPDFFSNILPEITGDSVLFLMGIDLALNGFLSSNRSKKWIYLFDTPESAWDFLERKFNTWNNIGCLYLSSSQATDHFQRKLHFPVRWLPQASTYKYYPLMEKFRTFGPNKIILNIGRPNKKLDEFFRYFSRKHGFNFVSQGSLEGILFPCREEFLSVLNNSAIIVVHPRNIDQPDEMGCVSMVTARYYEAYQSGAVVCGYRTTSGEFEKIFPSYPFVEMQSWDTFEKELIYETSQKDKWLESARLARIHHGWDVRVRQIMNDINDQLSRRQMPRL